MLLKVHDQVAIGNLHGSSPETMYVDVLKETSEIQVGMLLYLPLDSVTLAQDLKEDTNNMLGHNCQGRDVWHHAVHEAL
jgi:hypothetical protein